MKTWQRVKNWFSGGCVYFTVVSLILLLLRELTNSGSSNTAQINTSSFFLILPFGLCMSAAGMLLKADKLPRWSRYLLHFGITVASLLLFIWLPSNTAVRASTGLFMLLLFSVLYWIFFGLIMWIYTRVRKLMEED